MSYRTDRRRKRRNGIFIPLLLCPLLIVIVVTTVLVVHFTTRESTPLANPCGLNLCENNSTCVNTTNTTSGFLCTCPPGFNGTFCENALEEPIITVCNITCEYGTPQQQTVDPIAGVFRRGIQKGSDGLMYVLFAGGGPAYFNYIGRTLKNGTIDTSFGINGYITVVSPTNNIITDFLPLDDGAFVCLSDLVILARRLWRANSDGTIDVNFPVITPAPFVGSGLSSMHLFEGQNGGFFYYQLDVSPYTDHFLKYTPTGLDPSYGIAGRSTYDLTLSIMGIGDQFTDVNDAKALDDGSLIVFCSIIDIGVSYLQPTVVKLTPTGAFDTNFGTSGFYLDTSQLLNFGFYTPKGGILSDGSIIWGGWGVVDSFNSNVNHVFKLTPAGQLNTTWSNSGSFQYLFRSDAYSHLDFISVEPCDGLVIGVSAETLPDYDTDFHIIRLNADGIFNPLYPIVIPLNSGAGKTSVLLGSEFVGDPLYYHVLLQNAPPLTLPCV